jgi:hypothetical protein
LFVGKVESGQKCAIPYTIVENCRRLKIDIREYLTDVLKRLPAFKTSEAGSLAPATWLNSRSGKAVSKAA